jgi:hypothetical protein
MESDNPTEQQLQMASNIMHMQTDDAPAAVDPVLNKNDLIRNRLICSKPVSISSIPLEGYCDIIVQVNKP